MMQLKKNKFGKKKQNYSILNTAETYIYIYIYIY